MNISKLKEAIKSFETDLDGALLSCNVWEKKIGLSITGYNVNEKSALLGKVIDSMELAIDNIGLPPFGEYQIVDLKADALLVIMHFDDRYLWGSLIDKTKVSLGMLISIAMPNAKEAFANALKEI
jgi:hypothetical protein